MGVNHFNFGRVGSWFGHQVVLNGHYHLTLDEQTWLADQEIQGEVYRAFQAIFDGNDALF